MRTRAVRGEDQCFYCERWIATRQERDHWPIPDTLGGDRTVAACFHCHDLKDRTLIDQWPVEMMKAAQAQLNACNSPRVMGLLWVTSGQLLASNRDDGAYETIIWGAEETDHIATLVRGLPYPARLLVAKLVRDAAHAGARLQRRSLGQWNLNLIDG